MIFFFNDTATTEIYTLSLHDALPIRTLQIQRGPKRTGDPQAEARAILRDRKSTRLNSSHLGISYAVFCLKKKKTHTKSMSKVFVRSATSYSAFRASKMLTEAAHRLSV